jgi:hypothetical protein
LATSSVGGLFVKGTPIVLVVFAGHHRGTTEELHDAEGRIAAIVADHFRAAAEPSGPHRSTGAAGRGRGDQSPEHLRQLG